MTDKIKQSTYDAGDAGTAIATAKTAAEQYQDNMEGPMEHLAHELTACGLESADSYSDAGLVHMAAKKMHMLFAMLVASGMNPKVLKAAINS